MVIYSLGKSKAYSASIVLAALWLLGIHLYRTVYDYQSWKIDCSVAVMVLATKIIYLGSDISETGLIPLKFYESFGYFNFFISCLVGPTLSPIKYK